VKIIVLARHHVRELLTYRECAHVVREALARLARGRIQQPLRTVGHVRDAADFMGLMPAYSPDPAADRDPAGRTRPGADPRRGRRAPAPWCRSAPARARAPAPWRRSAPGPRRRLPAPPAGPRLPAPACRPPPAGPRLPAPACRLRSAITRPKFTTLALYHSCTASGFDECGALPSFPVERHIHMFAAGR